MSDDANTTGSTGGNNEPTTVEQLPEFARNLINNLRTENASARVKKNEAVEAAKLEAKTEFEAQLAASNTENDTTKAQLGTANLELAKLKAAIEAGVPTDKVLTVADRLKGNTEEELKADAESVKGLFGIGDTPAATDPSIGRSGGSGSTGDSAADAFSAFFDTKLGSK